MKKIVYNHLKTSKRCPSNDFCQISERPPDDFSPNANTTIIAANVIVNWRVSVQTTAFKPPMVV